MNLATNRVVITYDESRVTPEVIYEEISRVGFSTSLIAGEKQNEKKEKEGW